MWGVLFARDLLLIVSICLFFLLLVVDWLYHLILYLIEIVNSFMTKHKCFKLKRLWCEFATIVFYWLVLLVPFGFFVTCTVASLLVYIFYDFLFVGFIHMLHYVSSILSGLYFYFCGNSLWLLCSLVSPCILIGGFVEVVSGSSIYGGNEILSPF